jgi:hypothetical protein
MSMSNGVSPLTQAGRVLLVGALAMILMAPPTFAQSATSGAVIGTVNDQTGAVIPKADVQLTNVETNATQSQSTNGVGTYAFPNVAPGNYKITVKLAGFRTASISDVIVEVNKSVTVPIKLDVGSDKEVVEVTATATAQLQTTDAQVGNSLSTTQLLRLPTLQRNVTELMALQPGVVTQTGNNANLSMRVTGAIDDQNIVTVDGIDVTANVVASGTTIPTTADSVEEFRVTTANPNANFARASGGQIALIGRHGTNDFHGAGYWYHQTSDWNTNTWDNNFLKQPKPDIQDNRYGGRVGGPIFKNKTFFFTNFEGRRFDTVQQLYRTVPSDLMKQGILQFRDPAGNIQQFNLKTSALCGPTGDQVCDPRGLGISPSVKALWNLMPAGNPSITAATITPDGLNTLGYLANVATPTNTNFGVVRLDHTVNEKLTINTSFDYDREIVTSNGQISIANGNPISVRQAPQRGLLLSIGATYQIKPTLINAFRFGYVRDQNEGQATPPTAAATILNIPGTSTTAGPIAIIPGSGVGTGIDTPIDMDTQRARYQAAYAKNYQWGDDLTWVKGKHTFQFGTVINKMPFTHVRADKVVGSISSLVTQIDANVANLTIPSVNTPRTCNASSNPPITTNCIKATDATNWARFYASTLGLVDNTGVLLLRDANLAPQPYGTPIINNTNQWASYFYGQDSWRVTKSLTLTFGLSYGVQTAPTEEQNRQTVMVNVSEGNKLIDPIDFLNRRKTAALAGDIYNPVVGFVPIAQQHVPVYNIDWGNLAPRAAFAWNPSATHGILGTILGDRRTVVRGGFSMVYDRSNAVQAVEIPMLGVGFDQTILNITPSCAASNAAGAGCNAGAGLANPGASVFRVGVDGSIPLPVAPTAAVPVVPSLYGETLSFQVDPNTKVGRSYNTDLTVQRELKGGLVLEVAYVGRFARHLPQAVNLEQAPYFMLDKASGQTFAQAFDAVAGQLRSGVLPPNVTAQPWFENQLPGIAAKNGTTGSATAFLASKLAGSFTQGNLSTLFQSSGGSLDQYRRSLGLTPYMNDQAQMEFMRTYVGESNYNGMLVSINKRLSKGLVFGANYTLSKALDSGLANQNNAGFYANSFHLGTEYGPSTFDRTHVFNGTYVYDLPIGKGHMISSNNVIVSRLLSGWATSGIFTAWSGLPVQVVQSGQVWGDGLQITTNSGMIPTVSPSSIAVNSGVAGSSGIGTNGDPAKGGTSLNLFSNPAAVYNALRYVQISSDTRSGRANPFRGLGFWNQDASLQKDTTITERIHLRLSMDFFNIFNHPNFATPALNYTNPSGFGVIGSTLTPPNRSNSARWIAFGMRIEF